MFSIDLLCLVFFFFFQAEDGIRDRDVTGVQTCALPISQAPAGQVHKAEPGASLPGSPGFSVNGHPYLGGVLGREAVEAERRQEAEDPSGNAAAGFSETVP